MTHTYQYKDLYPLTRYFRSNGEIHRDYIYNRAFLKSSIDVINEALHKVFPNQHLTKIAITFLRKPENEDLLLQARNWAIYYLLDSSDYAEFNRALESIMNAMTIDNRRWNA